MAAKTKAAPVKAAPKKTTAAKASPKGLQLSTAQWKAYNTAFSAAASAARNRIALQSAASGFRKYRLAAAYATVKQYQAARRTAQAAAIAAYAARQSWRQSVAAHQNSALRNRIELDMYNHANLSGRLQYAQAGEKAYAHQAVMRTVDNKQALSYEARQFKAISRTAKKAKKSVSPGTALSKAQSATIARAGAQAGLKAARSAKSAPAAKTAKTPRQATVKAPAATAAGKSAKAPVKAAVTAKGRTARSPWAGDETTPNCIVTAVANHLIYSRGVIASTRAIEELEEACGPEPPIEEVLWQAWVTGWPRDRSVRLHTYRPVEWTPAHEITGGGLIIGYETEHGPHAALSLASGDVVSWGGKMKRKALVEEAWFLQWQ
jgi:hypothetical protein